MTQSSRYFLLCCHFLFRVWYEVYRRPTLLAAASTGRLGWKQLYSSRGPFLGHSPCIGRLAWVLKWRSWRVCTAACGRWHCRHGSSKPEVGFTAWTLFVLVLYRRCLGVCCPFLFSSHDVDSVDTIALPIDWWTFCYRETWLVGENIVFLSVTSSRVGLFNFIDGSLCWFGRFRLLVL